MWIRTCTLVLVWLFAASPLSAQEAVPASLSLQQALEISRTTNPSFLQTRNDEALADWNVRQAWGALLPSANASTGVSWQGAGEQLFGSLTAEERSRLKQRLKAKLQQYRDLNGQVDGGWVRLNETDPNTKMVYPLHLDALP